jgi:hypothetical protein
MNKKVYEVFLGFQKYSENLLNDRLRKKMRDVCNEHPDYVADELLLLSEEILSQVSAYGVCLYLQKGGILQTEKNNDYILHDLFLHDGHQNAGPVFYNVRNLVQELTAVLSDKQNELFNSESDINKKLQELAAFRNALMHGFFKLPAERNLELVKEIQIILEKLLKYYEIFKHKGDFHFWKKEGFSGHWNLLDNDDWNALAGEKATSFEKLADKAQNELHSPDFLKTFSISHEPNSAMEKKVDLEGFISSDFKESLYVQFNPRDKKQQYEFYDNAYALLKQRENVELLSYTIDENGIGFTSYLLFARLVSFLTPIKTKLIQDLNDEKKLKGLKLSDEKSKNKLKDKVESLINDIGKLAKERIKLVILINNIHLVPFASDHITALMKFFKESEIYFIGIGWEYEHLNPIFSQKLNLRKDKNAIPNKAAIEQLLKNHTRHRGPFVGEDDYKALESLMQNFCKILKDKKQVIARQYADEQHVDIELVNEALYILYPYFKYVQSGEGSEYIKDDLDELYGFPKNQTETSSIFLTLSRRDIDLEYKHKILIP